jgi:hypothetical protein
MASNGYFLCLEKSSEGGVDLLVSILNTAGRGSAFYGAGNDAGSISLWFIYKPRNSPAEIKKQLEANPIVRKVTVVELSRPVTETELTELRAAWLQIGWDTSDITQAELSDYINTQLAGQHSYYIDGGSAPPRRLPVKIRIRRLQDHPGYSPDWPMQSNYDPENLPDRDFTADDFIIETVEFTSTEEVPPPPPPPGF